MCRRWMNRRHLVSQLAEKVGERRCPTAEGVKRCRDELRRDVDGIRVVVTLVGGVLERAGALGRQRVEVVDEVEVVRDGVGHAEVEPGGGTIGGEARNDHVHAAEVVRARRDVGLAALVPTWDESALRP